MGLTESSTLSLTRGSAFNLRDRGLIIEGSDETLIGKSLESSDGWPTAMKDFLAEVLGGRFEMAVADRESSQSSEVIQSRIEDLEARVGNHETHLEKYMQKRDEELGEENIDGFDDNYEDYLKHLIENITVDIDTLRSLPRESVLVGIVDIISS